MHRQREPWYPFVLPHNGIKDTHFLNKKQKTNHSKQLSISTTSERLNTAPTKRWPHVDTQIEALIALKHTRRYLLVQTAKQAGEEKGKDKHCALEMVKATAELSVI